jgi:hypothetical protein
MKGPTYCVVAATDGKGKPWRTILTNLRRVQKWLGHKRIETTLIYAHLAPGDLDTCAVALEDNLAPAKSGLRVVGSVSGV